jgi:2-methylcitrate dehydratase PrpD
LESVSQRTAPNPLAAIAVALALGEKMGLSGKKTLEGFILGFEIQGRVGAPSLAGVSKKGRISIFNHLGAAAAGSKLLKLDPDQTRMALGIAAFQAGGLIANVGTMAHVLELAGSLDGLEAAELAMKRMTSHPRSSKHQPHAHGRRRLGRRSPGPGKDLSDRRSRNIDQKYPAAIAHRALDALLT